MSKCSAALLLLVTVFSGAVYASGCPELTRKVTKLKEEYRSLAHNPTPGSKGVSFDELADLLDKIIALKAEMRKAKCRIPPWSKEVPVKPKGVNRNEP
jgi:hypothetical protein